MTTIQQLMRDANPAPDTVAVMDDEAFDDLLLLAQTRSGNMDMKELTTPLKPPKRRWTGWVVAAAAFAVIIVTVGLALLVAQPSDEGEPVAPPTTQPAPTTTAAPPTSEALAPLEIAAAFVEARNNYDGAAMEALLRPGAIVEGLARVPSDFPRVAEYERALGTTISLGECRQADRAGASTTVRVSCLYTFANDWSRALGVELPQRIPEETPGNTYTFEIAAGEITRLESWVTQAFFSQVLLPFVEWLEQTHPDDVDLMFAVGPRAPWPGNRPLLDPEALALWERYSQEFVDFVTASG